MVWHRSSLDKWTSSAAMKLIVLAALVVSVTAYSSFRDNIPKAAKNLKGDALRDYVKSLGTTWTAGDAKTPHRQNIMSIKYAKHPEDVEYAAEIKSEKAIPESFDARTQWPACKSIGHIRDQSRCGSCWAVSTSAAFTDRVCIASNGTQNPNFSEEDVLSCCGSFCSNGCDGGLPIRAWQWAIMKGFCTGSGFYENTGCKPYSIEPCGDHTVNGIAHYHDCTNYHPTTPTCSSTCTNRNYNISYPNDKYFAKSAYAVPYLESAIQNEIMTNGPVVAAYLVYDDFYDYERGVYEHVAGDIVGAHAVKVIGWGVDNGTPYWLVANSWNTNFGENGFFRIIRGKNECGFEELVSAGLAKKLVVLAAIVASATAYTPFRDTIPKAAKNLKGDALRDYVNSLGTTWTAGDANPAHRKKRMSTKFNLKHPEDVEYAAVVKSDKAIPESFDARTQWPACKSIGHIRDQSQCGSCWAFSTSAAFTDRVCIASNGKQNPPLSAEDVLSCCGTFCNDKCEWGLPIRAWQWAITKGYCTGSGFYENTGCKPYSLEPCDTHTVNGITHHHDCTNYDPPTPTCSSTCTNRNYNISYPNDKHFARSAYAVPYVESAIQTEIMTNGPLVAAYLTYDDFDQYTGGVYQHVAGDVNRAHAVKVIGWGVDNGTPYWLVANSWNTDWGENGFFRIIRGKNECGFEEAMAAGLVKV